VCSRRRQAGGSGIFEVRKGDLVAVNVLHRSNGVADEVLSGLLLTDQTERGLLADEAFECGWHDRLPVLSQLNFTSRDWPPRRPSATASVILMTAPDESSWVHQSLTATQP